MVSLTISEEVLKREGEELIDQLKNSLDEYEDLFRMRSFCSSFFETIKRMKEDLNIAESVAMYEQLKREGKPLGENFHWYHYYKEYKKDKTEDKKTRLVDTAPSGFFRPDFESIFRILDLVDIEMEIFEDLYFDVCLVLKKYEIYQILKK